MWRESAAADRDAIELAAKLAVDGHAGQTRIGGAPYVIHPMRVALSLLEEFHVSQRELIQSALCHDLLEDTPVTAAQIAAVGPVVIRIVRTLTRDIDRAAGGDTLDDPYVRHIVDGGDDGIVVKLADKLDNVRDAVNHPDVARRRLYVAECHNVYLPLAQRLHDRALGRRIESALVGAMRGYDFYSEIAGAPDGPAQH